MRRLGRPAQETVQIVDEQGYCTAPEPCSHWNLTAQVRGYGLGASIQDGTDFRVKLEFSDRYPEVPPQVWFCNIAIHHGLDDHAPHPPNMFYKPLVEAANKGTLDLKAVMERVDAFLTVPLHPCDRCDANFASAQQEHHARLDAMSKYAPLMRTPAIFGWNGPPGSEWQGWKAEWFDPALLAAMDSGDFGSVLTSVAPGVYCFPMFTLEFCALLLDELDNYYTSGLPIRRPNSMNNYGIIVNEIGMEHMIDALQRDVLQHVARACYPVEGAHLDHHHSFMVQYKQGQDLGLDMHTDDSDVTFNVCLGRDFTGAGLTFCGGLGQPHHRQFQFAYQHVKGTCLVHLGSQRHGADDIVTGERNNLIIWNRNHTFRRSRQYQQRLYEKEAGPPDPRCVSFTHDRDYGLFHKYPVGKNGAQAWCPPDQFRHDEGVRETSVPGLRQ